MVIDLYHVPCSTPLVVTHCGVEVRCGQRQRWAGRALVQYLVIMSRGGGHHHHPHHRHHDSHPR